MHGVNAITITKLLLYFQVMVNTKTTPKKSEMWYCHFCNKDCRNEQDWEQHTLKCGKEKREKEKFRCKVTGCHYATGRKADFNRHQKRVHGVDKVVVEETSDWETQNPGNLSGILCPSDDDKDLHEGRTIRKPTKPSPIQAPKRKSELLSMLAESMKPQIPSKVPKTTCTIVKTTSTEFISETDYESDEPSLPIYTAVKLATTAEISKAVVKSPICSTGFRPISPIVSSPIIPCTVVSIPTPTYGPTQRYADAGTQTTGRNHHHRLRRKRHLYIDGNLISESEEEEWDD